MDWFHWIAERATTMTAWMNDTERWLLGASLAVMGLFLLAIMIERRFVKPELDDLDTLWDRRINGRRKR